jgi:hypothetical protein
VAWFGSAQGCLVAALLSSFPGMMLRQLSTCAWFYALLSILLKLLSRRGVITKCDFFFSSPLYTDANRPFSVQMTIYLFRTPEPPKQTKTRTAKKKHSFLCVHVHAYLSFFSCLILTTYSRSLLSPSYSTHSLTHSLKHTHNHSNRQFFLPSLPLSFPYFLALALSLEVEDLRHLHLVGPHKVAQLQERPRPQRQAGVLVLLWFQGREGGRDGGRSKQMRRYKG